MNFFKKRKLRKEAKHVLHEARHFRRMNEDIADPEEIARVRDAERELATAIKRRDYDSLQPAMELAGSHTRTIVGDRKYSFIREHLEIAVVALSVAMAVRTYFFQPFKIPTGSMQPTLYGITVEQQSEPTFFDRFPLNYIVFLYTGEIYKEYRAKASGTLRPLNGDNNLYKFFSVGGVPHKMPKSMRVEASPGDFVRKGEVLAQGRVISGDHIFVDRVSYNFRKPDRGDIFVFRTDNIVHPDIPDKTYYIKRLVGLPGETISIDRQNNILVNGDVWNIEYPENWSDDERALNYHGQPRYIPGHNFSRPGSRLDGPGESVTLREDQYLPMGDNTRSSLDGRYFGGVQQEDIVGPAFMVYWLFNRRWGLVD